MAFLSNLWSKAQLLILSMAVIFCLWQAYSVTSLQRDVTRLEGVQVTLQEQVKQVEADFKRLDSVNKQNMKTSEEFVESMRDLNVRSTDLEKSFSKLDQKASVSLSAAQKAQENTMKRGNDEKLNTEPPRGLPAGDSDAEWRRLLDDTYCQSFPKGRGCSSEVSAR